MFRTESVFFHKGYKCVVVFTSMGHRCGTLQYVEDECKSLAEQLDCLKEVLIQTRTQITNNN